MSLFPLSCKYYVCRLIPVLSPPKFLGEEISEAKKREKKKEEKEVINHRRKSSSAAAAQEEEEEAGTGLVL